ncbi:MAG: CAP domain-containing protein [Rhodosalinus sp.]|uniref:CAP domain-containing protein n=2 Tax=Rhodosalinus sp. TaxID=2047741 RepID=UPI003979027A
MITAAEQLLIEYLNRARLDPEAEAARYGIDLNADLAPDTLDGTTKQPLAPDARLHAAAQDHSEWMLQADEFSHTGEGGSSPHERMEDAGYVFTGTWRSGENIAWSGTTGRIDLTAAIDVHHEGLFKSAGHRQNILQGDFREIGIAQVRGDFAQNGTVYDASMLTQNFAVSGDTLFLTGVAYDDSDADAFYSVGEGVSGVDIRIGAASAATAAAGGYGLALPGGAEPVEVTLARGDHEMSLSLEPAGRNVKLDLVGVDTIRSSASVAVDPLDGGALRAVELLGREPLDATGAGMDERLTGNAGDNRLTGAAGADTLVGGGGEDSLEGGGGADHLYGGAQDDTLWGGPGRDTLTGGDGDDTLGGGAHDDRLWGGDGDDVVYGSAGNDELGGGPGHDKLWTGSGDDTAYGAGGDDLIGGARGEDTIWAGTGADTVYGGEGADLIGGGGGADHLFGGDHGDTLYGGDGADRIGAGAGADVAFGGAGDDTLRGGEGADRLYGGPDADRLEGGAGDDTLTGGGGADHFVFVTGTGNDVVRDFAAAGDLLDLAGLGTIAGFGDLLTDHLSDTAPGALISAGADSILLEGVAASEIGAGLAYDADSFLF